MIKTVIFFFLMICPKFTRLSDVSDLPANTLLTVIYTDHTLKKSKAKRRINNFQINSSYSPQMQFMCYWQ